MRHQLLLLLLIAMVLCQSSAALAQTADGLVGMSSELFPTADDENDSTRKVQVHVLRVNAMAPLPLGRNTILMPGLKYDHTLLQLTGGTPAVPSLVLSALQLNVGLRQRLGDRFALIASAGTGFASDFSRGSLADGFLVTGTLIGLYEFRPAFSLGGGVTYDQRTGTPMPLPALLLNWRATERFRLRGFVPSRIDAEFRHTRWLSWGVYGALNGDRYAIDYRHDGKKLQVAFSTAQVGGEAILSPSDWTHFGLQVGAPVYRRYDLYERRDRIDSASLGVVPVYGFRFWIGPSMWDDPNHSSGERETDGPRRE